MSPLTPKLQALIDQLPPPERMTFQTLVEAMALVKYTGQLTLHVAGGVPKRVDLGLPVQFSIVEGEPRLDTPPDSQAQ